MFTIPESHPRYKSLQKREKIVAGIEAGITSKQGLIAHGRGEAFDYLIGEQTLPAAMHATEAAAALLRTAERPVISVNGNVAALVPEKLIALAALIPAPLEVNIFYWTEERVRRIAEHLERLGATNVLGREAAARIPGIAHARARADTGGIYAADVVFTPLEDGDRCEALIKMGKKVISVDLNPFSRTSRYATVSIVDDVERTLDNLITLFATAQPGTASVPDFDNQRNLSAVISEIVARLRAEESDE